MSDDSVMHPSASDLVGAYWRQYLRARGVPEPNTPHGATDTAIGTMNRYSSGTVPSGEDDEALAWEVNRRSRDGGPDAVNLLAALAGAAPDEESLGFLGAGPLEELVNFHGLRLAEELDEALDREPKPRTALSYVRVGVEDLDSTTRLTDFFFGTR